jgi:hypothetical protein
MCDFCNGIGWWRFKLGNGTVHEFWGNGGTHALAQATAMFGNFQIKSYWLVSR